MEELLSSYPSKLNSVSRGQEVEGKVIALTSEEVILDISTKADAVLSKRELPQDQRENLKLGDKLRSYVFIPENEVGQTILTLKIVQPIKNTGRGGRPVFLTKFMQAQRTETPLSGQVIEVNKGGFMVEVDSVRGFLPNSQIGIKTLNILLSRQDILGQSIEVKVIEADERENRLVFSQKGLVDKEALEKLKSFKNGDKVKGKVAAVFPFGLAINLGEVVGLVFSSDMSWDKTADINKFQRNQEVEVQVLGLDEALGRLNLSLKHLSEDPFQKLAEKFQPDDVVKGEVLSVSDEGITIKLDEGIEGLLPTSKIDPETTYEVGKTVTILIDTVDTQKRKINLAPMVTSTAGLIYK